MKFNNREGIFLQNLLRAPGTEKSIQKPQVGINWKEFTNLSEFHHVSNIAHYGLLGFHDIVPESNLERFFDGFRKAHRIFEMQEKSLKQIKELLERFKISYLILPEWTHKECYPQTSMRLCESIQILIQSKQISQLLTALESIKDEWSSIIEDDHIELTNTNGVKFVFFKNLFPAYPKLKKEYAKIWTKALPQRESSFEYQLNIEDRYVYMISSISYQFTFEEVDLRSILDVYFFTQKQKDKLDEVYVRNRLLALELEQVERLLVGVTQMYFDSYQGDDMLEVQMLADYFWTKDTSDREACMKFLPMIMDAEIRRARNNQNSALQKIVSKIFPSPISMYKRYPALRKLPVLLVLFWIYRWFDDFFIMIRRRFAKTERRILYGLSKTKMVKNFIRKIQAIEEEEKLIRDLEEGQNRIADED